MNKKAIAKTKYVRISPRKMVGICKLVRGKDLIVARTILMQTAKKGARIIEKTLNSAVANAKVKNMDEKKLFISSIVADMGPSLKRSIPWSRGTAKPIKKRMTHLVISVEERIGSKLPDNKKKTEKINPPAGGKKSEVKIKEVKSEKLVKEKKLEKPKVKVKEKK